MMYTYVKKQNNKQKMKPLMLNPMSPNQDLTYSVSSPEMES